MRKLLYTFIQTGLFAAISCIGLSLQAQDMPFIQSVTAGQVPDSPEMTAYRERLRKNPNITGYHFIKLNALATSQKDGLLLLHIPDGPIIVAAASHVEYESASEYEWIGKTNDDRGTVIVISKAGRVCAHISTPTGVYEIFPAPSGLYCLQEIDSQKAGDVGCATISSTTKPDNGRTAAAEPAVKQEGNTNAKMQPCQALVNPRVLVLFTLLAYTQEGSVAAIVDKANLSVAQFNSCIYNSGITGAATLTLAGVEPVNFFETPNNMGGDIQALPNNPSAQNLRNQYQADLVVLFTNGQYGARGATASPLFNNSTAYSIVQIQNTTANKTFPHEVGHIFGCRHDDSPGDPSYARGYNLTNFLGFIVDRTVMSTNTNDGSNRLLNFSNPNISVGGKATGNSTHNNALRVTETYPDISNFRQNPNSPLSAYIDGPSNVTTPGGKNYEIHYSCGSPPYTFSWQYSYDGVNYIQSNTTSEIFTWYFNQTQKIYIKGIVVSNNQSSAVADITVDAQIPNPYRQIAEQPDTVNIAENTLRVAPNPASQETTIEYHLLKDSPVQLDVLRPDGSLLTMLIDSKTEKRKGRHVAKWSAGQVPAGIYIARFQAEDRIITERIVIQR